MRALNEIIQENRQLSFGHVDHDSLQFHFFTGNMVGACRLFSSKSLRHASLWLFDGTETRELFSSDHFETNAAGELLDVSSAGLRLRDTNGTIHIDLHDTGENAEVSLVMAPKTTCRWGDTISDVLHSPDMDVQLVLNGQEHAGMGYCKRYGWTPAPHYWGYRFIQGFVSNNAISVWTAEATFGTEKYDYFKILLPDGRVVEAAADRSCHRQNSAHGSTEVGDCHISIEEIGVWQTRLASPVMDSLMRQRACRTTITIDGEDHTGFAINETCYGTLG